jgi:hypothetical protein
MENFVKIGGQGSCGLEVTLMNCGGSGGSELGVAASLYTGRDYSRKKKAKNKK